MEHEGIRLWQHDFNNSVSKILTAKFSLERIRGEESYSEIREVEEMLNKTFDKVKEMGDELFIELRRLKSIKKRTD